MSDDTERDPTASELRDRALSALNHAERAQMRDDFTSPSLDVARAHVYATLALGRRVEETNAVLIAMLGAIRPNKVIQADMAVEFLSPEAIAALDDLLPKSDR